MRSDRRLIWIRIATFAAAIGAFAPAAFANERVELQLAPAADGRGAAAELTLPVALPGAATAYFVAPAERWRTFRALEFVIHWPEDAPPDAQVLLHLMDWDFRWFQWLAPGRLKPGAANRIVADLSPGAPGWTPDDHFGAFQFRTLMAPREFGVRVFGDSDWKGDFRVERAVGLTRPPDAEPPRIRRIRANTARPPVFGKFELQFDLPDRYANPFDPDEIDVRAVVERPDGVEETVAGFFHQDFVRQLTPAGERYAPQGPPVWMVRYAPRVAGRHRYRVFARDARGEASWGPGEFEAQPSRRPGFVRVSKRDPRYFEFDNGDYFFPLGHNIRSPFDTRYDRQFPWQPRLPEGPAAYERHFRMLNAHRANFAEVWLASWSLGLEWREGWEGYHGIGQYNLQHAWQMDRVVREAERHGVYLNVVIHNHGKYSEFSDPEWKDNPFNVELGGYLAAPDDFFTHPRARADFLKLMRYINARWGHSPSVFAWELWSELDLVGTRDRQPRPNYRPEVIEWHADVARAFRAADPYARLIATHVCGDYTRQNPELVKLPELDFAGIDAYHGNPNPLHIVELLRRSAEFNNPFNKPVLVTEFGGSPMAQQGVRHVTDAFFAAIWSSTAIPLGGAPLFWWWHMVEEEGLFGVYAAVARFMEGEDRRDPELRPAAAEARRGGDVSDDPAVVAMASPSRALGWIYRTEGFDDIDPDGPATCVDAEIALSGLKDGAYEVEFWNTQVGERAHTQKAQSAGGTLRVRVPPFARDLAFKVRPAS